MPVKAQSAKAPLEPVPEANMTAPPMLAFTMTRPRDEYYTWVEEESVQGEYTTSYSAPTTILPPGVYPGLHFESTPSAQLARGPETTYVAPGNEGKARAVLDAFGVT